MTDEEAAVSFNPERFREPAFDKIAAALAKAQSEMLNAQMNKINPHFKSRYADLASIREATLPALNKNGLAVAQFTKMHGDLLVLHTRLIHTSGQFIEGEYPLPMALDKPQVMGSAYTYAKRYSWAAICAVSAEEDDDANAASPKDKKAKEEPEWKAVANRIKDGIDAHKDVEHLNEFIKQETKALGEIKAESQSAYEFLMTRAEAKRGALAQEN